MKLLKKNAERNKDNDIMIIEYIIKKKKKLNYLDKNL